MVPVANLLAFTLAALVIIVLPGPNVLFVIGRALSIGRLHAVLSVAGCAAGMFVQVIVVSAGLGVLLEQSIVLLTVVKFAGAGFLVYLAVLHCNFSSSERSSRFSRWCATAPGRCPRASPATGSAGRRNAFRTSVSSAASQ